jgi:ribosome-binding protein aMBF1 (putative translation factor)
MKRKLKRGRRFFNDRLKEELKSAGFRKAYEDADIPVRLAIEIAKIREKKGISQKTLANKIGTRQQVISRIENLEQTNMTIATLQQIAHALNVHLHITLRP